MLRYGWVLFLLAIVTACGFKLRGSQTLPPTMAMTYVKAADLNNALIMQLKRALNASNITVTESPTAATAQLTILENTAGRRTLSVGTDGKAVEYEVFLKVAFEVSSTNGQWQISKQSLSLSRDFVFDRLGVLAASEEEAQLRNELQRDMVRQIMDRIALRGAAESAADQPSAVVQ